MTTRKFNQLLRQIADDFGLDGSALVRYAREDTIKGEDKGNADGTAYTFDGKLLYALVRLLKPQHVLEIGTYQGGSATHIAAAIQRNGSGHLITVDIWDGSGLRIPEQYMDVVEVVHENIDFFLERIQKPCFDFIFEDGPHSEHSVHNIYGALPRIAQPDTVILSHDTATGMGEYIRNGMKKGGADMDSVRFYLPSPVGMSVYRYEGA